MEDKYIVRAVDVNGSISFYNGKAGDAWLTDVRADAFGYQTREAAQRKAKLFNEMTGIHGQRFIAILD